MVKKKKGRFGSNVAKNAQKSRQEGKSSSYLKLPQGVKLFKEEITKGKNRIKLDIIPYLVTDPKHPDRDDDEGCAVVGEPWYKRPIYVHFNVGTDNEALVCPRTIGKKCPICEYRGKQFKNNEDEDDVVDKAKTRILYNVIPVDHKKYEEELHVWEISAYNFQDKLNEELEEDVELGEFPDPENGMTLAIKFREETVFNNKFPQCAKIDFEDRDEQYGEEIIDEAPNLDECFKVLSYEEVKNKFFELDAEEGGEEDEIEEEEDEKPRKSKYKKSSSKKKEDEDEDEVEDEDEDEDAEPDPPTKKKSSRRRPGKKPAKKEEPEEEEDDDEKPKKKSAKNKKSKKLDEPECPAGGTFGKDWNTFDECDECPLFDDCGEKNEELEEG